VKTAIAFLVVICAASAAFAQGARTAAPLTLAELEQLALANNPTRAAAEAALETTRALARQAGAKPNPVIGYSGRQLKDGTRDEHGFFWDQIIPLGGKLGKARTLYERTAEGDTANVELQRQRIISSVRTGYYRVLAAERQVQIHERLGALTAEAVGVTGQLFNVGAADRSDHLAIEIEALRIGLSLTAARNNLFAVRQELAALTGVADVADRPLTGSIEEAIPEIERAALLQRLIDSSPQMRYAKAEVERAKAATSLAQSVTSPDLLFRTGATYYMQIPAGSTRPLGWFGEFEAGLRIPLFNHNSGGIAAARADETRATAEVRRVELALRAEAAAQFAVYLSALNEAETYRTQILTRAEEAYRLFLARYKQMAAAYPQVLVAQQTLVTLSREYLASVDHVWRAALALQGLLAGDGLMAPGSGNMPFVSASLGSAGSGDGNRVAP
jgi:cobalt-zinc-cadmium efflux system outer membrane protein